MEGFTGTEPPLSEACCGDPALYPPIAQFRFYGRIWSLMPGSHQFPDRKKTGLPVRKEIVELVARPVIISL